VTARRDDFEERRSHLRSLSDDELHRSFWELVDRIVEPLIEEARTYTTPSIERSVLQRMGFSSVESSELVTRLHERDLLGHGAGRQVLELATREESTVREAGEALLAGQHWESLPL